MVSPLVMRTSPMVICEPPPVKRPVPISEQSLGKAPVVEADCPPGNPLPQLSTAIAVTVAEAPAGTCTEPENVLLLASTKAPEPTATPFTRTSTRVFCANWLVVSQADTV